MQFRKAVMQDVDAIWEIEQSVFSSPWSRVAHELVANPNAGHWVLDDGGSIIGFIMSYIVQYEVQIINIAVRLSHQYRGYGKRILSEFLSQFNEKTYLFLEVRESNLPAYQLYSHFGFDQIDIRRKYYHDGEDAIVMAKMGNKVPANVNMEKTSVSY
jgi:ribosomal-protein-alanine N-acetyltransferase